MGRDSAGRGIVRPNIEAIAPYRPGKRIGEMRRERGLDSMVKLSSNESPLPPFPKARAAIRGVADSVNRYPDSYSGVLRERLVEHMGVPADQLCLGNGSNELIALAAQAVLRPGDEVVCAWPSFVVYPIVAQTMEADLIKVPLTSDWRHDLEVMADAITDKTRIVFVCSPNNPTGTIARREPVAAFMERVPSTCLVVFDEAYFEYVDDEDYVSGMKYFDGERPVVVLRTFSKAYGLAGLRVGYGAFPTWLAAAVEKLREPFNVNMVAQIAAYHSLDQPEELQRREALARAGRCAIYAACDRLGVRYERSEANFVAVEVDDGPATFAALVERGIIVRSFGDSPMLRVTVGTEQETERFCQALADILAAAGTGGSVG